jgi:quercetin dioxygenase-like cupin family protein
VKATIFSLREGKLVAKVSEAPALPFEEFDGKPLDRVTRVDLHSSGGVEMQFVEIKAGGNFAMHSSPATAFCQIVRGRGKLGLPDGTELDYAGPELYVFLPNTLHDWHNIEEDTQLSVCLVDCS